jgi:hypothetical protein
MIKDMVERQNSDRASSIMNDRMNDDGDDDYIDRDSASSSYQFLSARDIYMRVAQNLEFIQLYSRVNQEILNSNQNQSELFA